MGSQADTSLFIHLDNGTITYLLIYVDDTILTGKCPSYLGYLIHQLGQHFARKDLGLLITY